MQGQAATSWEFVYQGSAEAVRSDGREPRTLIDAGVLAVDLGPAGTLYAAREVQAEAFPITSSVLMASVKDGSSETVYAEGSGTYSGVASSSDGRVATSRHVTMTRKVPPFLSDGIDALRYTSVPVLVPPEEPPGTEGLVPTTEEDSFQLLFTNDPAGELSHAEQINVMVTGTLGTPEPIPDPQSRPVRVRGSDGQFFCGASACFLTWQELDVTYTVGEFGTKEDAVAFAESLVSIEALTPTPALIVRDSGGNDRVLRSAEALCECGLRPLDWNSGNDRLLVLASAEGSTTLQEYQTDGSGEPSTLAEGVADPKGLDVILDAAYGPNGVVALFGGEGGPPGTLRQLEGSEAMATNVRAFDIEGSTLAYVRADGDVIVRDLSTGNERTVGRGAIDVSVAPDLISGSGGLVAKTPAEDEGVPALVGAVIVLGALGLLLGVLLLTLVRQRRRD